MSPVARTSSSSDVTTLYIAIPEGPLVTGRVKDIRGEEGEPDQVHPSEPHEWHELDHYGEYGTGFAMCRCGAIGVMYDDPTEPLR